MNTTFVKEYKIATGILKLIIYYNLVDGFPPLDFHVIEVGELEYGYEDQDELIFSPNIFRISITDYQRKNYYTLNEAFTKTPEEKYNLNHSVEVYLNNVIIYYGYIEKTSLKYDEKTRHTSFECVDFSIDLKNLNVEGAPEDWAGGISDVHYVYKKVFPNLQYNVTNNVNTYITSDFNGLYLKHDWKFLGNGTIGVPTFERSWDINNDPDGYNHIHIFRKDMMAQSQYYIDYIKAFAKEFGMAIGTTGYNKVYLVKRFISSVQVQTREISDLINDYNTEVFLKNIIGVRNIPQSNQSNVIIEGTFQLANPIDVYSDPKNSDNVIDLRNLISFMVLNGTAPSIRVSQGSYVQTVLNGVLDPSINSNYEYIERIIAKWTLITRRRPRSKYEIELRGIDYGMHEFYKISGLENVPLVVLRPLNIKLDLLRNKTNLIAIEVLI